LTVPAVLGNIEHTSGEEIHMKTWSVVWALLLGAAVHAEEPQVEKTKAPVAYDAALAAQLGADEHGMRQYVLVILKTGPTPLPKGEKRDAMFKGHFANMERLAAEGKLAYAGPLDGKDGWRGLFVFAVSSIDEAKQLAETDPVIVNGEMIAEYHVHYGSAALMAVNATHQRLQKVPF
jgi:uncharacterized protein YciI